MHSTSAGDVYEFCANFVAGDQANGSPGFKIDPNGAWGNDSFPSADYAVAAGWVKISYNSTTKVLTTQQNLPVNCGGASSSSSPVSSSSSVVSSAVVSTGSSSLALSSSSVKTSSSVASSSSSAALVMTHNAGFNCLNCHKAGGAGSRKVTFTVAGTIMKSDDTPQTNATITFIEAGTNATITLKTDGSGNFYTQQAIAAITTTGFTPTLTTPVQGSIAMGTVATNGGCNSCHNVSGDVDMRLVRD